MHVGVCNIIKVDKVASSWNQASDEFKNTLARNESLLAIEVLSEKKTKSNSDLGCFKLRKPKNATIGFAE